MAGYFANIRESVATIFEGMAITASHFVRKPFTIQYPDRIDIPIQDQLPFRYRGILDVDLEICTGCLACERACPIDCIVIEAKKNKETKEMVRKGVSLSRKTLAKTIARWRRGRCYEAFATWKERYRKFDKAKSSIGHTVFARLYHRG